MLALVNYEATKLAKGLLNFGNGSCKSYESYVGLDKSILATRATAIIFFSDKRNARV